MVATKECLELMYLNKKRMSVPSGDLSFRSSDNIALFFFVKGNIFCVDEGVGCSLFQVTYRKLKSTVPNSTLETPQTL
jgi:hypothetical protein